jgi:aminomethyltransferase
VSGQRIVQNEQYGIVRMSEKRKEQSPYIERWASPEVVFAVYANRMYPVSLGTDPLADYWKLRTGAMLYDVPERPVSIQGPDAVRLLELVFTRPIAPIPRWRGVYGLACVPDGGILMDGVLMRLADDRFWYVQADGDIENWLAAHAVGMDVEVSDPGSRVIQIQGPRSHEVLAAATGAPVPDDFGYFALRMFNLGGQEVLVSNSGWTGELGIEIYGHSGLDHLALWDHLMQCGEPFDMTMGAGDSMGPRRIEAGILDNRTDFDRTMSPYAAGLGRFVNFDNTDFIGRAAILEMSRDQLLFGVRGADGQPVAGDGVLVDGAVVGRVTVGDWSPTLETGIGYVRFDAPTDGGWRGQSVLVRGASGEFPGEIVDLPFFDPEKRLPRGLPLDEGSSAT